VDEHHEAAQARQRKVRVGQAREVGVVFEVEERSIGAGVSWDGRAAGRVS
jgi:hypothetical protein